MAAQGKHWQRVNRAAFVATIFLIVVTFAVAFPLERWFGFGHIAQLGAWLRILATVALISTAVWSAIGFLSLYFGPHEVWNRRLPSDAAAFSGANACCLVAIGSCATGVVCVWVPLTHGHLWAAAFAENLFWLCDYILLSSMVKRLQEQQKLSTNDRAWVLSVGATLKGWIDFVARPATISLVSLSLGVYFLEFTGILTTHLEVEIFATGALFLSLMTANLAFYAVNKGASHSLVPPASAESFSRISEQGMTEGILSEPTPPARKHARRRRRRK